MRGMKSQVIKAKNLPVWTHQPYTIHVKPVAFLAVMGLAGIGLFFTKGTLIGVGLILTIVSIFALLMMPDRILAQFTPDYMILYNHRDKNICSIIYWDELVNWQYEYHGSYDVLSCCLIDGTVQSIDLYSKRRAAKYINMYAPGKEIKTVRRKDSV